jgi:tRNA G18 (ribose-2'-O)-methylase SpoU
MNIKRSMQALERLNTQEYSEAKKAAVYIVLDNVRSALNVGSVFRTADAFRCESILLCGITATPPNKEINKTALGATETVSWKYYPETTDALIFLKSQGIKVFSVEQATGSIFLDQFQIEINEKYAFVFGNEVDGVAQNIVNTSDACLEIPQFGTKHSLNVAVCAGIVLYHTAGRLLMTK